MTEHAKVRVAINGYGEIGKRVADAVVMQEDMEIVGVSDIDIDWHRRLPVETGFRLFGNTLRHVEAMRQAGLEITGSLDDLISRADVVVDCTRKQVSGNVETYRSRGIKFIVQGGEPHAVTGHSFVADASFDTAIGRQSTRVVSCNTTSIVRTLMVLKRADLLIRAQGTLLRRAPDPWGNQDSGIMNSLVSEADTHSHQGCDAQTVDPDLDVVTRELKVPEMLGHLHYWVVEMPREASRDEVLNAFRSSPRITLVRLEDGLAALNTHKELVAELGRPHNILYEVALWEDMLQVDGRVLFYAYMVEDQAIVIPETIDAIRALTGRAGTAEESSLKTNAALLIGRTLI